MGGQEDSLSLIIRVCDLFGRQPGETPPVSVAIPSSLQTSGKGMLEPGLSDKKYMGGIFCLSNSLEKPENEPQQKGGWTKKWIKPSFRASCTVEIGKSGRSPKIRLVCFSAQFESSKK